MTTVKDLVARARQTAQERTADTEAMYWNLVRKVGGGGNVDPQEVLDLCERLGCDLDQFQKDAEAVAARFDLKKQVDTGPGFGRRKRAAEAKLKALDDEFERAQAKYLADRLPHEAEFAEGERGERIAQQAVTALAMTNPYPWVHRRREAAAALVKPAAEEVARIEAGIREIRERWLPEAIADRDNRAKLNGEAARQMDEAEQPRRVANVTKLETALAESEGDQLPAARRRLEIARAELAAAEAELIVP